MKSFWKRAGDRFMPPGPLSSLLTALSILVILAAAYAFADQLTK